MIDEEATRTALEQQRTELRREIVDLGARDDIDEVSFDADAGFSDRSHSTEERARTIAVVKALRSNLRLVERALVKLDAGTYGACERCGNPIAAERLEAIPWAILCIDCKKQVG
jgi:RNA polymerase-binding transcription factor